MAGFRPCGNNGSVTDQFIQPGDTMIVGDTPQSVTGTVATTIPAAALVSGICVRSGATTGAFSDVLDSAANIIAALASGANFGVPQVEPGSSFKVRVINTTGYTDTLTVTAGSGTILSTGGTNTFTIATTAWRDLLFTVNNLQNPLSINSVTGSGSTAVTFALATGYSALPIGPSPYADNIQVGATVTGTGIANGTTVAGVTQGQGGIIGVTLSGTATATGTTVLSFGPTVTVTSLGAGAA